MSQRRLFSDQSTPYLLLAPAVILVAAIVGYPIAKTIYYSLTDFVIWNPSATQCVWFKNYFNLFKDSDFINSLFNTLQWVLLVIVFQFLLGLFIALLLNRHFWGRSFFRAVLIIPWVTPSILVALMWMWMYHGTFGIFNFILQKLGIIKDYIPWLAQMNTSLYAVIFTFIWKGTPFFSVMLLAGLANIPKELYEAGKVDGTSKIQAFFYITLPCLKNTILITTLLRIIWVANNVDLIFIMTGGGPASSSMTVSVNTYITAMKAYRFGYASAMSIILTLILLIIAIIYIRKLELAS